MEFFQGRKRVVKISILLTEGPINIVSSEISQLRDKETFKI